MYSRALVTLQNIAGEPGHIAKKLSKKDNFPNYMGQQSCFHLQQNTFYLKFSFKKKAADGNRPQASNHTMQITFTNKKIMHDTDVKVSNLSALGW